MDGGPKARGIPEIARITNPVPVPWLIGVGQPSGRPWCSRREQSRWTLAGAGETQNLWGAI